MDAIVVGGGNTLNMIAIWKAQGINTVLKKAFIALGYSGSDLVNQISITRR